MLLFGLSDSTWNGLTLPLNLAFVGYPTCDVLVAGHLMISATADARGRASFSFPVPNLQQLVGLRLFHQVVGVDPTLRPALTNGFVAQRF